MKKTFYTETAYFLGLLSIALGAAFMTYADFGLSMVVAPAYILHLKISQYLPFFSFGMAEYTFQAVVLLVMVLVVGKWKRCYLFSFGTAVLYGFMLDGVLWLLGWIPVEQMPGRILFFVIGMVFCSIGVSLMFHTYIPPEVYELFVKEVSQTFGWEIHKTKTGYDCCSCFLGILLSFLFFGFGQFEGVKLGTVVCTLINGYLISRCTKLFDHSFTFADGTSLRKYFR